VNRRKVLPLVEPANVLVNPATGQVRLMSMQAELEREKDRLKLLLDMTNTLVSNWSVAISFERSRRASG
jgi:hypothetical protein